MKKNILSLITAAALAAAAVMTHTAAVADAPEVSVRLNGGLLNFDVQPQIIEERTMVPLRAIFEALGATVEWDQATQTVTSVRDDTTIKMTIGSSTMYINGKAQELDVAPLIIDERTLVPVRAIAEGFGASVNWDQDRYCVIISSDVENQNAPIYLPTPAPAETPAPTAAPENTEIPFTLNSAELQSASVSMFKITSCEKNADGDYDITYTFETFLEGSGSVTAIFNCLDADGKLLDSFGGNVRTTDYTWTHQSANATVPAKTASIVLNK